MLYCLNPTCAHPENPDSNRFCHGCGESLANSSREYYFRVHYRVVKLLGEGAFGRTYLAEDTDLMGEPRVIKRFIAQGQGANLQKAKELFAREARQLYELNHPQIPKLYAYFEQNNLLFLIQEFVEGKNLFDELSQQGKFSPERVVNLLQELLEVLDYIHSKNVLHRDIKPENIMRRSDGKFILIDFGGAKVVTETVQNQTGTTLYTPGYAATEQMAGRPIQISDIYSLGVTCIRLLTGCLPQSGITGSLQDPLYDDYEQCWLWREMLQRQGRSVSQQLGEVLDKMVQSLPKNRCQSAREALTMLNPYSQTVVQIPSQTISSAPQKTSSASQTVKPSKHVNFTENLGNGITLEMVAIPGGQFLMGANKNEEGAGSHEFPQHQVTVQPFFMGKYPITQAQWKIIASRTDLKVKRDLNVNPSRFKNRRDSDKRPVESVSWEDAVEFCARLSKMTGGKYRLPSESEWEYACRANTTTPFYFGETITTDLANFDGNYTYGNAPKGIYRKETTKVGQFPPNAFGLFDMHGNVWEWCADNWHKNYQGAPTDGSAWLTNKNDYHLLRGGSWFSNPSYCRSAFRYYYDSLLNYGFRVVCVSPRTSLPFAL